MTQLTHKDIYTKFMIEYDKANVTSSYPSLTEYEVATFLDKAYNALIAQKVTGNNIRRSSFEYDVKAISDLQPLIAMANPAISNAGITSLNVYKFKLPDDFLYIVEAFMQDNFKLQPMNNIYGKALKTNAMSPVKIISHSDAQNFIVSKHNLPWIKDPVSYIEGNALYILCDPIDHQAPASMSISTGSSLQNPNGPAQGLDGENQTLTPSTSSVIIRYIKTPEKFAKDLSAFRNTSSYFDGEGGKTKFELNDTMAEELISLAMEFALENTESPRLNAKLNMRGLEA